MTPPPGAPIGWKEWLDQTPRTPNADEDIDIFYRSARAWLSATPLATSVDSVGRYPLQASLVDFEIELTRVLRDGDSNEGDRMLLAELTFGAESWGLKLQLRWALPLPAPPFRSS